MSLAAPSADCGHCPRLVAFRADNRSKYPDWHNAPVASFGGGQARLLVVGLAPGLRGANRTGRPFTGDFAGDLLYDTLLEFGFAAGDYGAQANDGLRLIDCRITNAVRCVPPDNKPVGAELRQCRPFLESEIGALDRLRTIVALGRIAHDSTISALGRKRAEFVFGHGAQHRISDTLFLFDSYHCSRYNTNTGRLTPAMFQAVFAAVRARHDTAEFT